MYIDKENVEREYQSQLLTQQGIFNICENCNQYKKLNNVWEIFHGYNNYCSLIGEKCHDLFNHHTHNICNQCLANYGEREKKRTEHNRKEGEERDYFLEQAKQFAYQRITPDKEAFLVRRNKRIAVANNLLDDQFHNYKNFCEECGGLLNSRKENWLIFLHPEDCKYVRTEILTCKVCFSFLAEKYFSKGQQDVKNSCKEVMDKDSNKEKIQEFPPDEIALHDTGRKTEVRLLFKEDIKEDDQAVEKDHQASDSFCKISKPYEINNVNLAIQENELNESKSTNRQVFGEIQWEIDSSLLVNKPFWLDPLYPQSINPFSSYSLYPVSCHA